MIMSQENFNEFCRNITQNLTDEIVIQGLDNDQASDEQGQRQDGQLTRIINTICGHPNSIIKKIKLSNCKLTCRYRKTLCLD